MSDGPSDMARLKAKGSPHYKTGGTEPIDLYKSGKMLRDFAVCNIIKYAYRNRTWTERPVSQSDMEKIIHYAEILKELA